MQNIAHKIIMNVSYWLLLRSLIKSLVGYFIWIIIKNIKFSICKPHSLSFILETTVKEKFSLKTRLSLSLLKRSIRRNNRPNQTLKSTRPIPLRWLHVYYLTKKYRKKGVNLVLNKLNIKPWRLILKKNAFLTHWIRYFGSKWAVWLGDPGDLPSS